MATEFVFTGSQDLKTQSLLHFMALAVDGVVVNDDYVRLAGLFITPLREEADDNAYLSDLFGFVPRITVIFRFSNLATEDVNERNAVIMVQLTLQLLDKYGGMGVLLFNHEQVVLQKLNGSVVVNSDWEELEELQALRELVKTRELRRLPQPLLAPPPAES